MARLPRTWWRRVIVAAGSLAVLGFVAVTWGAWMSPSSMGNTLFIALGVCLMLYGLLAGPLCTVDCLSRERREGTLGLLFLTDLRPYDVVLGKIAATSLELVFGFLGVVPILALTILLGGVSLTRLACVALTAGSFVFLSLSIGACASAFCTQGRTALGITLAALVWLSVIEPIILDAGGATITASPVWLFTFCPFYSFAFCLGTVTVPLPRLWVNLGSLHALGWICLAAACFRTSRWWRETPVAPGGWFRIGVLARLAARGKRIWRRRMLDRNPVAWLEGRNWPPRWAFWCLAAVAGLSAVAAHLAAPATWPDSDEIVLWPSFTYYGLCLVIGIAAPRRLADDKQSGALELLLCTPLPSRQIVRGAMGVLCRRFGLAFFVLALLTVFLFYGHYHIYRGWKGFLQEGFLSLSLWVLAVWPVQVYALARVGLYLALRHGNSVRATLLTLWSIGLLPWTVWLCIVVVIETGRRYVSWLRMSEEFALGLWGVCHLGICAAALILANRQLGRNFRVLAAQMTAVPWWKCWARSVYAPANRSTRAI